MGYFLQRVQNHSWRPVLHVAQLALGDRFRQAAPLCMGQTKLGPRQSIHGSPTCGLQPRCGGFWTGCRLQGARQPLLGSLCAGPAHVVGQAAAANSGQQHVRGFAGQDKPNIAWWFF